MSSLAIMAILSIVGSLVSAGASMYQQNKEFGQQQQLQEDAQEFQAQREDLLYQRNSIPNQFQQMLDSGFNPNLAAASLMGGNNVAAASSDSSPSAPTTNSAIGALSSMLGQGGQNLYDLLKNNAEIQNIEADTNKKDVESGLMPRKFALDQMTAIEQFRVWDASVERTKAAQHLDEEQTKLLQQQNLYYGRIADAQLETYKSQVLDNCADALLKIEQINTEKSKQYELNTQAGLNVAQTELTHSEDILVSNQSSTEYYKSERERIALELEQNLGGIPLTTDAQKYVHAMAKNGDVEGIKQFYLNIFTTAESQEVGSTLGKPRLRVGLPFGLLNYENQNAPLSTYMQQPFWNPHP